MRDLLRRLDRLEDGAPVKNGPVLIGWKGDPVSARAGGDVLPRRPGEGADDFKRRAAEHFRDRGGLVWISVGSVSAALTG